MSDPFAKLYADIAHRKNEAGAIGPYTGGNGRIDRAIDLILNEDFPRSGTILDVGGATGNLGDALKSLFSKRIVIDISEACRQPAMAKENHFLSANVDLHGLPLDADSCDLVVALDFIEHILDPENFSRECLRVLKPGGKVLINTPNIQYWKHLHSLVVNGVFPHTSGDQEVYHGGHVAFYNYQDMQRIFRDFGDHRIHTRGLTMDPPPPIWSSICRVGNVQLSLPDLVFSCRKP